jgi:hypothetical protein
MKTTLLIIATCSIRILSLAQDLISFKDQNDKYGYKDKEGKVVIQPQYNSVQEFKSNDYAIADEYLIDKTGKTVLIDKEIMKLNNLSDYVYLVSDAGQNEYWINIKSPMNSNGKHAKIDSTGKLISDQIIGSVSTIGYFNESGYSYKDPERLLICEYVFNSVNNTFDIYYQIMHLNGETISEKYTYFAQECDGYVVSKEKWNTYDQKTGTKLSKKRNNIAKNYENIFYFDFTSKCFKVDRDFKFIEEKSVNFIDNPGPCITFGISQDSRIESSHSSLGTHRSIRCSEFFFQN